MSKFKYSSAYVLRDTYKDHKLKFALYTSMTMDYSFWKNVMLMQAGYNIENPCPPTVQNIHILEQLDKSLFIYEGDSQSGILNVSSKILMKLSARQVRFKNKNNPCFHPKIVILWYECDKKPDYFRIGVFSKNLTNDSDLQTGLVIDGEVISDNATKNGNRISEFIKYITEYDNICENREIINENKDLLEQLCKKIQKVKLPDNCDIHFGGINDKNLEKLIINPPFSEMHVACKGEFVGEQFRERHKAGIKFYNRNPYGINGISDTTHVKTYLIKRKDESIEFWQGSANCSWNALNDNVECMVKLSGLPDDTYEKILEELYRDEHEEVVNFPELYIEPNKRDDEEEALDWIVNSYNFKWKTGRGFKGYKLYEDKKSNFVNNTMYRCKYKWKAVPLSNVNNLKLFSEKMESIAFVVLYNKIHKNNGAISEEPIRYRLIKPINGEKPDFNSVIKSEICNALNEFISVFWFEELAKDENAFKQAYETHRILNKVITDKSIKEKLNFVFAKVCKLNYIFKQGQGLIQTIQLKNGTKYANLIGLKQFQINAANHLLEGFKTRQSMLLADETGLGKTKVALDIILELADNKQDDFTVVYACSNARILQKNVYDEFYEELKDSKYPFDVTLYDCDRLSMMCQRKIQEIDSEKLTTNKEKGYAKRIHLYSFSTSLFDTKYSDGCEKEIDFMKSFFINNLVSFKKLLERESKQPCDKKELTINEFNLIKKVIGAIEDEKDFNIKEDFKEEFQHIRSTFNKVSVAILKPDLIILDEFHRFVDILPNIQAYFKKSKQLFLSATPYTMNPRDFSSIDFDSESDYEDDKTDVSYRSLEELVKVFVSKEGCDKIAEVRKKYEKALRILKNSPSTDNWELAKDTAQELATLLKKFMFRNERAMLEGSEGALDIRPFNDEIFSMAGFSECANTEKLRIANNSQVRYLKYVPGIHSFALKYYNSTDPISEKKDTHYVGLVDKYEHDILSVSNNPQYIIDKNNNFIHLQKGLKSNIYFSQILQKNVDGAEQLLWVPPSKPYYKPVKDSVFDTNANYTKLFIFSNYQFIPKAVGSLISAFVDLKNDYKRFDKEFQLPVFRISILQDKNECFKIAKMFNPKDKCWTGMDYLEITKEICRRDSNIDKNDVLISIGSPQICAYRITNDYNIATSIGIAFNNYFNKTGVKNALAKNLSKNKYELIDYCANGNLDAVFEEFLFVCNNNMSSFQKNMLSALGIKNSKVHLVYHQINLSKAPNQIICHFSERFTRDRNDTNENPNDKAKREIELQNAFNSPLWPMILTSTSVAQEGLNFHSYCYRIMHYTLPKTPEAFEQRDGRIDRYNSHLVRKRISFDKREQEWKNIFDTEEQSCSNNSGIFPYWNTPVGNSNYYMERLIPVFPLTKESMHFDALMRCRKVYRSIIGMPNEIALLEDLNNIANVIGKNINEIFPSLIP